MSPTSRTRLSSAFRKALADRRETIVDLAAALGVSSSTLRTWFSRHRFPPERAVSIAAYLGWNLSAADLENRYDVGRWAATSRATPTETKTLTQLFQEHDKSAMRLAELTTTSLPPLRTLFDAMQKGDLYVHIAATTFPSESLPDHAELRDAIAGAIHRGAFFLYVIPTDELNRTWLDEFSLRSGTNGSFLNAYLEPLAEHVQKWLHRQGLSEETAKKRLSNQFDIKMQDHFPWFNPGFSYSLIGSLYPIVREPLMRVWMNLPGDPFNRLLLPHSDQISLRIACAAFRLCICNGARNGDIKLFDYLMEFPGTWAF